MNPLTFVQVWMAIRPFARLKERREARKAAAAGLPQAAANSVVLDHPPEHVDTVIHVAAFILGGAKSKLIWLAVAQFLYAFAVLYINDGAVTMASVEPLLGGLLTTIFRITTGQTLAEKGA